MDEKIFYVIMCIFVIFITFLFINCIGCDEYVKVGKIINRKHIPSHTITSLEYDLILDMPTTNTTTIPSKYSLEIQVDGQSSWFDVDSVQYENDDVIKVKYYHTRITKTLAIIGIIN